MKGLLIKDLRVLFRQNKRLMYFIIICMFMSFTGNSTFTVGYTSLVLGMLAVSTISYDQADNGLMHLMTLPIDSRTYVLEKYVLEAASGVLGAVLGIVFAQASSLIRSGRPDSATLGELVILALPITFMNLVVITPLQLKFGAEKSRILIFAVYGVVAGIFSVISVRSGSSASMAVEGFLQNVPGYVILAAGTALIAAAALISCLISIKVMSDKEY